MVLQFHFKLIFRETGFLVFSRLKKTLTSLKQISMKPSFSTYAQQMIQWNATNIDIADLLSNEKLHWLSWMWIFPILQLLEILLEINLEDVLIKVIG